jgi:ribosomal protein S18 acetylase RimI-like enzyme
MRALYVAHRTPEFALLPMPEAGKLALLGQQYDLQRASYLTSHADARFLTLTKDDVVAGRLCLASAGADLALLDLLLAAPWRGSGVGSALLGALTQAAFANGQGVLLHVEKHNRALRLYQRLGFRVVGDAGAHWAMEARAS